MKLFSALPLPSNALNSSIFLDSSNVREQKICLDDDCERLIEAFQPDAIMAEQSNENNMVLAQAIKNWSGYGLFYPDIHTLDQTLLSKRFAKVILLAADSGSIAIFEKLGHVVFDLAEY